MTLNGVMAVILRYSTDGANYVKLVEDRIVLSATEMYSTKNLQCVSKKTSPTFLAVTRESIVGFLCLAHVLPRKYR